MEHVEGNAGSAEWVLTVTLSAAAGQPVLVDYATADGTARAGSDYTSATGTLTFDPGTTTQTIRVRVTGDTRYEADETFFLDLGGASQATIADGRASATVVNDDAWKRLRYDFGTRTSPVAVGRHRISPASTYDAVLGHGWHSGEVPTIDRRQGSRARRDFNYTAAGIFAVDLPNGTYTVTVTLGDARRARDRMALLLEGTEVAVIDTAAGRFVTRTFTVTVSDGQLFPRPGRPWRQRSLRRDQRDDDRPVGRSPARLRACNEFLVLSPYPSISY